jgi:transcriptional regulator with XRE-family HTH domain
MEVVRILHVGEELERAWRARGWNQNDVAEAYGVSQATVSERSGGKLPPTLKQLDDLARVVGADRTRIHRALIDHLPALCAARHPIRFDVAALDIELTRAVEFLNVGALASAEADR